MQRDPCEILFAQRHFSPASHSKLRQRDSVLRNSRMPHFLFRNSRMMERGLDRARPDPARQTPGARTCLRTGGFDTTRFEEFGRCADATCERPGQDGDFRLPVLFTTARAHLETVAGHVGSTGQAFGSDMRGQAGALPTIPGPTVPDCLAVPSRFLPGGVPQGSSVRQRLSACRMAS